MRFAAIHKLSSYLMIGCAFGALALSGELSPIIAGLGVVGIFVSWFWEPPFARPERWTPWWNAATIAAFAYTVLNAWTRGEWVVSGAGFLTFLAVAKLFTRRSSRDYTWVYVLSFLMLVAGTTLNAEVNYALFFLGYVVTATWAMILHHLRREMEENFLVKHADDSSSERVEVDRILGSRRVVGPSFLVATSSISLAIFIGSALMFLLFPRVGFGLFFAPGRQHLTFAGFNDGVSLGGHGLIRSDDTVVMRVSITDPTYQGTTAPEIHWRGVAFDHYEHGQWSRTARSFATRANTRFTSATTRVILDGASALADVEKDGLRQEVYLEPLETSVLFAAAAPVAFELDNATPGTPAVQGRVGQNDEIRVSHFAGIRYTAWSNPTAPPAEILAAAPDADPKIFKAYLQIPDEIPQRVRDKAKELTAGLTGPYAKAEAIERYLKDNFEYTLVMESTPGREPLDEFLFDRKKGHCEYFSSAMSIMLRAAGVPTRNVNGFLGGEWNEYGKYIAVRAGDAHSWVEVWFDGPNRWVTYDPTPAGMAEPMGRGGGGIFDRLRRLFDNLRLAWFKWVIEYDLGRQLGIMKSVGEFFRFDGSVSGKAMGAWVKRNRVTLVAVLVGFVGAVGGISTWRRRRRAARAGPGRATHTDGHPVVQAWLAATRRLARAGHARPASRTPREHARELSRRNTPGAAPFAELTELYYGVRWNPDGAERPDTATARRLAGEIAQALRSSPH